MTHLDLPASAVEPFVRECLGCECPATVFEQVENDTRVVSGIRVQRLLAGQRLLVYLLSDVGVEQLAGQLERLQETGVAERDAAGYNRLRIVVPEQLPVELCERLTAQFERCARGDEKVHLHFVPREVLARYLVGTHSS